MAEGWWATLHAEMIPFEQRLEMGRVLRHIEYLWFCAKNHGLRQFGGATLPQQRVQYAGHQHTHIITPTVRPSLWRRLRAAGVILVDSADRRAALPEWE